MKKYILTLLCAMFALTAMGQKTVTGQVLDNDGLPMAYAAVKVEGTNTLVRTDDNGQFSVDVPNDKATLSVSYIGFEKQQIVVGDQSNIVFNMQPTSDELGEVVIVGFGTQKKINATGSVKTIGSEVLESRPISNAVQGLQGTIAGLNITNDAGGGLGTEMEINIRGVGSIGEGSSSSPLILIDGMEGSLSEINPNDIENVSVLKDAAAASIYGSRAPFGVILVTTKKGKQGSKVTYSGNVRLQQPISVPDPVDSYTFALMVNDAYLNSGGTPQFSQAQLNKILRYQRGELKDATSAIPGQNDWYQNQQSWGNTDWYDLYLKNLTFSHEHNVSVSGANEKVNYYFSGNYMGQTGLFNYADEKYRRLTLSGKIGIQFNKYVNFTWTTRIISIKNDKPSALNALFYHNLGRRAPTDAIYYPDGTYSDRSLIIQMQDGGRTVQDTRQFYNQGNLIIEPIKDWKLHFEINSRVENNPYTRQFKPIYRTLPDGSLEAIQVTEGVAVKHEINTDGTFKVQPAAGESYYERASTHVNYFGTNIYTDYEKTFNDVHYFKFLLGEQSEYYYRSIDRTASTNIVLAETPFLPSESGGESTMISEKRGEWSNLGIFGRINYSYDNKYMAEINLRADGASRFPSDQRWGFFPSFSAGWNIANESFFAPLADKGFHYLKLRASYGQLGNQNTTSFYPYYQQMYTSSGSLVLGGGQATVLPMYDPYSTSLTWERIENVGVGLDFGLFNNRLSGAFDWYQRTTKDMVGPANALSALYGADAPKTNNAEMRTRGWEFEVTWKDRIGDDFSYSIGASLSDYRTEITKYDSPDGSIDGWYQGKHYGDIWGYRVKGIAKSDAEMYEHLATADQSAISSTWGGGDLMYMDLNGDGKVTAGSRTLDDHGDLEVIGNNTPRYAYSITLTGKWKFLDARIFFQGVGKRDLFFKNSATFFGFGGAQWQRSLYMDHLDYFRYAGSTLGANFDSYYGRLRTDQANIQVSDRFLQNGAYLRLKNFQIGVSLPENTFLSKYVTKARFYVSCENLFTITKLRIYDPEAVGTNSDEYGAGKTYPQYRTYSFGLELTF